MPSDAQLALLASLRSSLLFGILYRLYNIHKLPEHPLQHTHETCQRALHTRQHTPQ